MERIGLADMPKQPRGTGESMVVHDRTDKSVGIDISGNATAELLARWRDRRNTERPKRRWFSFRK